MLDVLKVAFDLGGLISRYPGEMKTLMACLIRSGAEVFILTDMNHIDARRAITENNLGGFISADWSKHILSADWSKHGDLCKTILMEMHKINILIDDRPNYAAIGNFIGLVLSPRPHVPYYHNTWVNRSTPAVMVPPDEYEAFKQWKAEREP